MLYDKRSRAHAYLFAVGAVAAATLARGAVDPYVGDRVPYATYLIAVAAVGVFGSLGASLFATVLSALVASFLFVSPRFSIAIPTSTETFRLVLFLVTAGILSLLAERIQRTRVRLREAADAEAQHARQVLLERQRLQAIIQSIPGVIWEAWGEPDSDRQRMNYVSDYVKTMLGYTPEEWVAQPNFWLQLVHPADRERAARTAAEKFASGGAGENEFRWLTRDGRVLWVVARSSTIKDESGKPVGMRGVTFDITRRKEVEQRLAVLAEISTTGLTGIPFDELASRIARRAAEAVGDYCIIRMLRGDDLEAIAWAHVEQEAEPLVQRVAAYSKIAVLNNLYADIVRNPRTLIENDLPEEAFAHVDRRGFEDLFEKHRARHGLFTPLVTQGRLVGTLAIGRAREPYTTADTQFVEAIAARASLALENARLFEAAQRDAEEAQRARAQAEEAGRVKDEFLATLSHELRTPLNAILGWAHMLRDPQLPADRRQSAVETILRNAQSQEQLISDILDVQRIMAGKIRLTLRSVDLSNVVRAAAETVQPSADAKGVRLQLLLDLDVPLVTGDPDRLQQVVWNLLTNAIKFAPKGGRVQVRLLKKENDCELVVEDNGPGIDAEFIPYVFERFRQADSSTTRTHKGLGLGLAIVRSLVEMHGGVIAAGNTTAPGATGAVFTIRLPKQSAQLASAEAIVDRAAPWNGDAPALDGIHVLIVEDDKDARELLTTILQRRNANVTVASSVEEGVAAFEARRPDVVVSDIEMPHEDGYSFIRRIRARSASEGGDVPAAALTAYASPSDRMKVLGAGFNIHVAKPVQPDELAMVVASLAARRAS
jgi:PAS domain S-box-containing protein